jgi:hypothetical protein
MRWVAGSPSRLPAADGSWEISLTLNGASRSVPVLLDEIRALPRLLTVSSVQTRGDAEGIILVTVKFYAYAGDPQAFPEVAPE